MASTRTKADLAQHLSETIGLSGKEAKGLVEAFFTHIKQALAKGEPVKLAGFGSFYPLDKAQRLGRNPKTGQAAVISARKAVAFRPSVSLKKRVSRYANP